MKVVVVGSGAREHALALVLGRTDDVVVTPGNPGIPGSTATPPEELDADLYVVGPEQPLVDGLADRLRGRGKLVFGPGADGAQVEGSKAYKSSGVGDDTVLDMPAVTAEDVDFLEQILAPKLGAFPSRTSASVKFKYLKWAFCVANQACYAFALATAPQVAARQKILAGSPGI